MASKKAPKKARKTTATTTRRRRTATTAPRLSVEAQRQIAAVILGALTLLLTFGVFGLGGSLRLRVPTYGILRRLRSHGFGLGAENVAARARVLGVLAGFEEIEAEPGVERVGHRGGRPGSRAPSAAEPAGRRTGV